MAVNGAGLTIGELLDRCEALTDEYEGLAAALDRAPWWRPLYRRQLFSTMRENVALRRRLLHVAARRPTMA